MLQEKSCNYIGYNTIHDNRFTMDIEHDLLHKNSPNQKGRKRLGLNKKMDTTSNPIHHAKYFCLNFIMGWTRYTKTLIVLRSDLDRYRRFSSLSPIKLLLNVQGFWMGEISFYNVNWDNWGGRLIVLTVLFPIRPGLVQYSDLLCLPYVLEAPRTN